MGAIRRRAPLALGLREKSLSDYDPDAGLVGVGHAEFNQPSIQTSTTAFSHQFVGGLDYTLIPRVDWRIAEFSYGGLSIFDTSLHPKTISTGIVIRLPGIF